MSQILITRQQDDGISLVGKLYLDGSPVPFCYTLERSRSDPDFKPIDIGSYHYTIFSSPRFATNVIRLEDVPGRDAIEIHPGNKPADSHGCIVVADDWTAPDFIAHSKPAFDRLMASVTPVGSIQIIDYNDTVSS